MSYKLTKFGGVSLPGYNRESGLDTAPPLDGFVGTVLGGYDGYGTDEAPASTPYTLTARAILSEETDAGQRAAIDGLRALARTRGQLVRQADDDSSEQWATARLEAMIHRRITGVNGYQVLEFTWLVESQWHGAEGTLSVSLGSSPYAFAVENPGNRTVTDAILTITAGDAPITSVNITTTNGTDLVWAGTLAATKQLVINCGSKGITNDGVNAYGGFSYGVAHSIDDWLRIAGSMDISITYIGGGAGPTVGIEFYEGWK
jgi:hypothetical protein